MSKNVSRANGGAMPRAKAYPDGNTTKAAARTADAGLIQTCMDYAGHIAAARAVYDVDPTDAEYAAGFDTAAQARAVRAMVRILAIPPSTLIGFRAKVALVPALLDDSWSSGLDELHATFLRSIAEDAKQLIKAETL